MGRLGLGLRRGLELGLSARAGAHRARPPQTAFVFGQVTDARRATARTEMVLLRWRGSQLTQVFLDDSVTLESLGRLTIDAPRVPGVMALFVPGRAGSVPEELSVVARDGLDEVSIAYSVRDAINFLIPHPTAGSAHTNVAELVGRYTARGTIDGELIAFERDAFAEVACKGQPVALPHAGAGV